jgi:uncharacterized protein YdiU (UPF0061 family)
MATKLGLSDEDVLSSDFLNTFSGTSIYPNTNLALCYAGHQFGVGWTMGDGRYKSH